MSRDAFLSFGNPLLDMVVTVTAEEEADLVSRFGLQRDVGQEMDTWGSGLMDEVKHKE